MESNYLNPAQEMFGLAQFRGCLRAYCLFEPSDYHAKPTLLVSQQVTFLNRLIPIYYGTKWQRFTANATYSNF